MKKNLSFLETFLFVLALFLSLIILFNFINQQKIIEESITLQQFKEKIEKENISNIIVYPSKILIHEKNKSFFIQKDKNTSIYDIFQKLDIKPDKYLNLKIEFKEESNLGWFLTLFLNILPFLILIWFLISLSKQAQKGTTQIFSFGKSGIKVYNPDDPNKVTFKDVANLEEAKQELMEIVEFLKNPDKFLKIGAKIPKGVLLVGPPGTGKTLLARAVSSEAGVPFFYISGSEFVEMFVGVGSARVRDAFAVAKRNQPCLTGDAKITFADGSEMTIKEIFDKKILGKEVLSLNEKSLEIEKTKIIGVIKRPPKTIYELKTTIGTIKATSNHLFPVLKDGQLKWIELKNLKPGDFIASYSKIKIPLKSLNKIALGRKPENFEEKTRELIFSNVLWVKVKSIEKLSYKEEVYDLSLEKNYNFLANNFFVHNCILFIDELDAIGKVRGVGITGGHEEREQTLNQILVEMDGFEKGTRVVVLAASVTGDTPVLVKKNGQIMLKPIKEVIDEYYLPYEEGVEKPCPDLEVLGFTGKKNKRGVYFRKAVWQKVRSVFRHKVKEIYIIEYLGGSIKATGNHSVFVRTKFGVAPKLVSELKPGDCLVDLPYQVNRNHKEKERIYTAEFSDEFNLELNVFEPLYKKNFTKYLAYQFALANAGKFSQTKIAHIFGFSQQAIGRWIRGVSLPREFSFKVFKHKIPEKVKVTPQLMRLFGYYIAEGYSRKELDFCFNVREIDKITDLKHLMKEIFGLEPDAEKYQTPNAVNIIYYSKPLAEFFAYWCGKGAHNKHVPYFLFEAPKEYFIELLKGIFDGDGYKYKNGRLEITSVSKQLILELNWLSRMHGFKSYIYVFRAKEGRRVNNGKLLKEVVAYRIGWGKKQNPFENNEKNKFNMKRPIVRRIRKIPYDDYVYDFCGCENEAFFGGESPILLHNTNRPDVLDPALLRPGRFDRKIVLDLPDIKAREEILKIHLKDKKVGKVNLKQIAKRTVGFSGADLANLCNEAAILTARRNKNSITQKELLDSIEKVLLGPERKTKVYSKKEKEIAAYHEAGHAIVAHYLPYANPVEKISIISRGKAGGYTLKLPIEDKSFYFKKEFIDELASLLGGWAAEKLVFNDVSTGASNDLEIVTEIAKQIVTKFGMSEDLGPIVFEENYKSQFEIRKGFYSEKIAEKIDEEVLKIINEAKEKAEKILKEKRDKLELIAQELLKKEVLEKRQFEKLIKDPKAKS